MELLKELQTKASLLDRGGMYTTFIQKKQDSVNDCIKIFNKSNIKLTKKEKTFYLIGGDGMEKVEYKDLKALARKVTNKHDVTINDKFFNRIVKDVIQFTNEL